MSYIDNLTADGNTGTFRAFKSMEVRLEASGNFGGGTLTPQIKASDGTWHAYGSDTLTADGSIVLVAGIGDEFRANLSGSSSPDLNTHFEALK